MPKTKSFWKGGKGKSDIAGSTSSGNRGGEVLGTSRRKVSISLRPLVRGLVALGQEAVAALFGLSEHGGVFG
jgi:hypothetical protein